MAPVAIITGGGQSTFVGGNKENVANTGQRLVWVLELPGR